MSITSDADLLAQLVSFDTTSNKPNTSLIDLARNLLQSAGCETLQMTDPSGGKHNLLARRGPDVDGGLLLCGHVDCVPAGEPGWESDPFTLTRRDGRLIGRGAVDMKAFVALALRRMCEARPENLCRPLFLLLTHDEELGSLGAARFAREWRELGIPWRLPRDVIVGEPTGLRVVRMHKGHLKLRIDVRGRAAHSGYPHLGENAIERAGHVVVALARVASDWRSERIANAEHFPECPHPVLNVATIHGGSAVNIVPERCVMELGIRLLPGQQSETAIAEVRAAISTLPSPIRAAAVIELIGDNPPMLCDSSANVNRVLSRMLGQTETVGVSYASDAGWLTTIGLNCVLWGPGSIENAHQANEFIAVEQFESGGHWLDRIIEQFCVSEQQEGGLPG
ncbi:MAG: acetylornithine deacetylase [Phycisphaerae bacterium]